MKSFCFFFLLIAFVFSACNLRPKVEIAGVTAGVASGVVAINDDKGEMISAGRITNNQFKIDHIFIERSAFYTLELAPDEMKKRSYPVYLETGTYTVKFDQSKDYPVIKSTSQIQHEISTYYLIRDSLSHDKEQITVGSEPVVQQFNVAGNKGFSLDGKALDIFITRYPDNHIAAYLMSEMFYGNIPVAYKANPVPYYNLYKKLNAFNKATSEGRQIGKTLQHLVNVQPGKPAPDMPA